MLKRAHINKGESYPLAVVGAAGFTLVEVLVVAAIIAMLVAFLFPVIGSARSKAMTVTCASNLRQVGLVCQAFTMANRGMLPQGRGVNPSTLLYPVGEKLEQFMEDIPVDIWYCPSLQDARRQPSSWLKPINSPDWQPSIEFPLGYFYVGNPVPAAEGRFHKTVLRSINLIVGNAEFIFDYCSASRPCPVDGSQVESWYVFAHRSPYQSEGANVLLTDFSLEYRNKDNLTMGYSFDHPEDVYW